MKRILLIGLALILSAALWANGDGEASSVEEEITLGVTLAYQAVQDNANFDELYYFNMLREKFNVDFDITAFPENQAAEKSNIAFAAGELKDLVLGNGIIGAIKSQALKTGSFAPLEESLESGTGWINHPYWDLIKSVTTESDGHIYTLARANLNVAAQNGGGRIFYDVALMEELGFDEPESLDELYAILKAVQKEKPDIIPVSGLYASRRVHAYFMNAFGLKSDIWGGGVDQHINVVNNKIVFSFAHENYKAYLSYMNKLYNEGLLDPEYFTQTNAQMVAKGEAMKYFLMSHAAPYTLVGNNDNALRYRPVKPLTSDLNPTAWWPQMNPWGANAAALMADTAYFDKAFEILDWMGTLEGESSQIPLILPEWFSETALPEGVAEENIVTIPDSNGLQTEPVMPEGYSWWSYINTFISPRASNLPGVVGGWSAVSRWGKAHGIKVHDKNSPSQSFHYYQNATYPEYFKFAVTAADLKFVQSEQDLLEMYVGELTSFVDEMQAKFIMGVEPLDNYDAYIEQLGKFSLDKVTGAYQGAYDRYLANK